MLWGKDRAFIFGLLIGLLFPLLASTSINLYQYVIGKFAWAFGGASLGVVFNAIFQDIISKRKNIAEISGYRYSVGSISGTCGAMMGGALSDYGTLRWPYYGVLVLYVVILLLFMIKVHPYLIKKPITASRNKRKIRTNFMGTIKHIFNNPYLFIRIFTEGVTQSHWAMEPILFPLALYSLTHKDISTGFVFGMMGAIAMFMLPLAGRFVDKTSPIRGLLVTYIFYVVSLFLLAFANAFLIFLIGGLLLSIGKTFNGVSIAKIETTHGALAAFITGTLLKFFSFNEVFLIFACYTFIGFALGFIFFKLKER